MITKLKCILLLMNICIVLSQDTETVKPVEKLSAITEEKSLTDSQRAVKSEIYEPYWTWECHQDKCVKSKILKTNINLPQSLGVCKLKCGEYRTLWPRPTGEIIISETLVSVNPISVTVTPSATARSLQIDDLNLVKELEKNFKLKMVKRFGSKFIDKRDGRVKNVYINLNIDKIGLTALEIGDEMYTVKTEDTSDHINATVQSNTFFGAHHGVETLSQLIVFDPYSSSVVMPEKIEITDSPVYPYRGILMDTGRNFIPIDAIKRTIDGMAVNKLNYFHWHITDSQSFPLESRKYPTLTQSGAYTSEKIYSRDDIRDVVQYGVTRGVHVIPELDAPAHVGEGWNSIEHHKDELLVCFKKEPWTKFCVEPPCGQLNPVSDRVYEVLGDLYEEMSDLFNTDKSGLFHMGGDEVNMNCWKHVKAITDWMDAKKVPKTIDGFHDVWDYFQKRALAKLLNVKKRPKRVIIWTSTLTEGDRLVKYLDRNRYIIQIWTKGDDPQVAHLVNNKFPVIFSNYEALYFDCGFGAWVGEGNNWCSPYIGWQKVYDNDPVKLLTKANVKVTPEVKSLILGAEATLWTEQVDGATIDGRLWPRAAAMAERLWSNPKESWRNAEYRFLHQRERLLELGIQTEAIEPEWCYQNDGFCGDR